MPPAPLNLRGLVAPVFTPMRADGSLDLGRIEKQAEHLVEQEVVGVFVAGTTGEGPSLTLSERQQLAERWCAVADKRLPVIVHVGHTSVPDAKELAGLAQRAGAAAVAAVPPFYFEPRNVQDVVSCCVEIASAAPGVPFYYYHIPDNTGVRLNVMEFLPAAEARVPTLAGLKFSDDDLLLFGRCADAYGEKYDLFFGRDELLLPALALGAKAAIGTTYNFAAHLFRRMIKAFERGDMNRARRLQDQSRGLVFAMNDSGGLPAMKATMRLLGVDCGPCRLPLRDLSSDELEMLEMRLQEFLPLIRPEGSASR